MKKSASGNFVVYWASDDDSDHSVLEISFQNNEGIDFIIARIFTDNGPNDLLLKFNNFYQNRSVLFKLDDVIEIINFAKEETLK